MGRRQVHVIVVRKWVTIVLLVLVTAAMAALLYFLSGRAYAAETHPFRELLARILGSRRPLSRDAFLAFLMPVIANAFLFVPWGFLAFVAFDAPARSRVRTYAIVFATALIVAALLFAWQQVLPTRVTAWPDAISNAAGALAGAALGHARKTMRVRFAI